MAGLNERVWEKSVSFHGASTRWIIRLHVFSSLTTERRSLTLLQIAEIRLEIGLESDLAETRTYLFARKSEYPQVSPALV